MSSSRHTLPSLADVNRIREEAARAVSLDELRPLFERARALRTAFADDFDASLAIADLQEELVQRGRTLRNTAPTVETAAAFPEEQNVPPDVEKIDAKAWQRAVYIGLFFAVILFAAFFYLIQTARRLNLSPEPTPQQATSQPAAKQTPAAQPIPAQQPVPERPAVRVYTDLVPGTVTIDDQPPQDLKDGEFTLQSPDAGTHKMRVSGASGSAEFSFDVNDSGVPHIQSVSGASNAMLVLVATDSGVAHLASSAQDAAVEMDNKSVGHIGPDGLSIPDVGTTDHLLQVEDGKDRQKFILTYTAAPTLTVYVKSDPNIGTVIVQTKLDGADVFINDKPYKRQTEHGQLRIPLRAGEYTIRVHKPGYIDPPPATVTVKKAEESALSFKLDPAPQFATLQVRGALPGTMVYIDKQYAATAGADGVAAVQNVQAGNHLIELRRDQALPKRFERTFKTGDLVLIAGPDATLDRAVVDTSTPTPPPPPAPVASTQPGNYGMQMDGQQVRKGGGFVTYHVPHVSGQYSFAGHAHLGGLLKHGRLQWYAGYQDPNNYILFTVDGKHATIRQVKDGKSTDLNRIPFEANSDTWVQVSMSVTPNTVDARIKTPDSGWQDLGPVSSGGQDLTQGKVGFLIPEKEEVAVSNFRFSPR